MRKIHMIPILLLTGCTPVSAPSNIELCEQTVLDYGHLRDEGPADQYADLFATDGEFHLGPNLTKGRDALTARHNQSNASNIWRHNMTDVRIRENIHGLTGTTRFHIFLGPKGDTPQAPAREILGDYIDEFTVENGMCLIQSRTVKIVFDTSN